MANPGFAEAIEAFDEFAFLRPAGMAVALARKSPIDPQTMSALIQRLVASFPGLTDVDFDAEEKKYTLKNEETELPAQVAITVWERGNVDLAWGLQAGPPDLTRFAAETCDHLSINAITASLVDFRFVMEVKWDGDLYAVLRDVFFNTERVEALFPLGGVLQNDVYLLGYGDSPERRVILSATSSVKATDILKEKFDDESLSILLGYGQTKFRPGEDMASKTVENVAYGLTHLVEHVIPGLGPAIDERVREMAEVEG